MSLHPYSVLALGGVSIALFAGAAVAMTAGVLDAAAGLSLFVAAGAIYGAGLLLGQHSKYEPPSRASLRTVAPD